jgi:hypothetical protein
MSIVSVTVQFSYENHTVELTETDWKSVKDGKALSRDVESYYEGGKFTYTFSFNRGDENTLCVYYSTDEDFGDGFIGRIEDAMVDIS